MYPSKILLFGEYTILLHSEALAVPFAGYYGEWGNMQDDPTGLQSNQNLKLFCQHLENSISTENIFKTLHIKRFKKDLQNGLCFRSSIPGGAGLGSSGAVVAAVFDRYTLQTPDRNDIDSLQKKLATLENYFHTTSSGIDPLVSYLNKAVHIKGKGEIYLVESFLEKDLRRYGLFLVKSGLERTTGNLVAHFNMMHSTEPSYLDALQKKYIPLNNSCIEMITQEKWTSAFFVLAADLSRMQLQLFEKMIPEKIRSHFSEGLSSNLFFMKLCGAGGGGFFAGFTSDPQGTRDYFDRGGLETTFF